MPKRGKQKDESSLAPRDKNPKKRKEDPVFDEQAESPNAALLGKDALARTSITEAMVGVAEENATGINKELGNLSGRQAAYDDEQCIFALKNVGKYKCALSFIWMAQPRISSFPLREESIKSQQ